MSSVTDFTNAVEDIVASLPEIKKGRHYSDIVDDNDNEYVDLVMGGGGMLGLALAGYIHVLEKAGIRFLGLAGTSAGSIVALLLACAGPPHEAKGDKVLEIIANMHAMDFVDGNNAAKDIVKGFTDHHGALHTTFDAAMQVPALLKRYGLNPGDTFREWMEEQLAQLGIMTTNDMQQRLQQGNGLRSRVPDRALPNAKLHRVAAVTCEISTQTKVIFPDHARLFYSDPGSVNPAEYVCASMSIPFFFQPHRVENLPTGEAARDNWDRLVHYDGELPSEAMFVDGGMMSNFPINLFHINGVPMAPTFGVQLSRRGLTKVTSVFNYGWAVVDAARHCLDFEFITSHPDYSELVGIIDTKDANWLDFNMSEEKQIELFVAGAQAAQSFLRDFDWEEYKKIRKSLEEAYMKDPYSTPGDLFRKAEAVAEAAGAAGAGG